MNLAKTVFIGETVFEIIKEAKGAAVVMVQRHYSYLSGPTANRAIDEADLFARNYSGEEPSVLFLCDKAGIEQGWKHGEIIAKSGLKDINIIASHQGRGPDSGLRISEGYHEVTDKWLPVSCHRAVDYPIYNYQPARTAIAEDKDPMVAKWLKGLRPSLIKSDTPESFRGRVAGFVQTLLKQGGITLITTHFELCVLIHTIYVEGEDLRGTPEEYVPPKGGGILLIDRGKEYDPAAYDYDVNFIITKAWSDRFYQDH